MNFSESTQETKSLLQVAAQDCHVLKILELEEMHNFLSDGRLGNILSTAALPTYSEMNDGSLAGSVEGKEIHEECESNKELCIVL